MSSSTSSVLPLMCKKSASDQDARLDRIISAIIDYDSYKQGRKSVNVVSIFPAKGVCG